MPDQQPIAPFAVSTGDPAGIGPEIICKSWEARKRACLSPFFAVGDASALAAQWDGPIRQIDDPAKAVDLFDEALPVMQVLECGPVTPGQPNADGAQCAYQSLEAAVGLARSGNAGAVVPAPSPRPSFMPWVSPIPARPNSSPNAAAWDAIMRS